MMGGFGFGDFSRQAQRLAAAAQQARYNNEVRKPSSFTCLHLHIEWQLSEARQQILRSPTALAVLLVEHAYSSLFFDSILARHVAGARRNGPTRFGVWFAAPARTIPQRYTPIALRITAAPNVNVTSPLLSARSSFLSIGCVAFQCFHFLC